MYELTVVLEGNTTPAKSKSLVKEIEAIVKGAKGKVIKTDDWGSIDLAYPIKKNRNGKFLYFELELPTVEIAEVEQKVRLSNGVIRHLLIKS